MSEVEKVSIAGGDKQMILHAQEQALGFYLNRGIN
jgi:hypothetical protein